ncbi:MAG: hypothetical protein AUJ70_00130 [Candidatus Omnitrophica bacterium CG1_02_40_15]|nr:MAG: hypothetical protein AUJ70_00130 [Candidatus Omnitrophica bacterium CG1_02_40_15]
MRLTDKVFWEAYYKEKPVISPRQSGNKLNFFLKKVLGNGFINYWRKNVVHNHEEHVLWDVIYDKYLPKTKGLKVLEVGSAPGYNLLALNKIFGYVPYGVEYLQTGVEMNRRIFLSNNIDPDNVICSDFFDDKF